MFHLTDHNALLLEINLGIPTNRKKSFGETYWKPNSSILGDKNYDANWKVEEERLEKLRSKFEDDVDWWNDLVKLAVKVWHTNYAAHVNK